MYSTYLPGTGMYINILKKICHPCVVYPPPPNHGETSVGKFIPGGVFH